MPVRRLSFPFWGLCLGLAQRRGEFVESTREELSSRTNKQGRSVCVEHRAERIEERYARSLSCIMECFKQSNTKNTQKKEK